MYSDISLRLLKESYIYENQWLVIRLWSSSTILKQNAKLHMEKSRNSSRQRQMGMTKLKVKAMPICIFISDVLQICSSKSQPIFAMFMAVQS
jgi:hypothetical protein